MLAANTPTDLASLAESSSAAAVSLYNYPGPPTRWVCYIFVVLFGVSSACHGIQTLRYRLWWLLPTVNLAAIAETLGWSMRLASTYDPTARMPFIIQTTVIVLAPTPYIAAIFIIFSRITERMGVQYTRLPPRWYSRIFLSCDIISLFIQGGGGGIASSAASGDHPDPSKSKLGGTIMLVGIIFQLISIIAFITLALEFYVRFFNDLPFRRAVAPVPIARGTHTSELRQHQPSDRAGTKRNWTWRLKALTAGMTLIMTCIFIRSVYRSIELQNGWDGPIARTQVLFNVLDGAMLVISLYMLNICHPGWLLFSEDTYNIDRGDAIALEDRHAPQSPSRTKLLHRP
ncbi:hypothetical protein EIP91_007455 [Steccherinum ochraceum]|uniref:Uncharacterized protein n=1 Tax=Steccherinum ochraceum TaxID=92696 RepID=A0A4R0RET5_9APHY|nr:hypothetical protein EIP91_007455 [Steccherinum ochraceum]